MEHLRAAILYFHNFVAREAAWLGRASNAVSAIPADGECVCSVCLRSLGNVVLIRKAVKGAHYCGNCTPSQALCGLVPLLQRWRAGAAIGCFVNSLLCLIGEDSAFEQEE